MDGAQRQPTAQSPEFPARPILTAAETLNWIAFGAATNADLTGYSVIEEDWCLPPWGTNPTSAMVIVLRMLANNERDWPEATFTDSELVPVPRPQELERLRHWACTMLQKRGLTAVEGLDQLRRLMSFYAAQMQRLTDASGHLADALAGRTLSASASAKPVTGRPPPPAEVVPYAKFATVGVRIWRSGEIDFPDGSGYVGARFQTDEVARLWPAQESAATRPLPLPTTSAEAHRARGGRAESYDWKAFTREVVRFALLDGFNTRRELTQHMEHWCATNWAEPPSERSLRDKIKELCPPEVPEK